MSVAEGVGLGPAVTRVLQGDYLDVLMIAGRLARREQASSDPTTAASLRAWVRRQLDECRRKLELRHFSGAPAIVVEVEIAIVAFMDNAAASAFGLSVWRPLSEDLRNDYIDAGREARSVVDLGKYVYERLERLRTRPDLLAREPIPLLEMYDRCWRLGYRFSYEGRPNEFEDIKAKIRDAIAKGAVDRKALQPSRHSGPLDADVLLSPHLPAIPESVTQASPISARAILSLLMGILLLGSLGLSLAVYRDRLKTERVLQASMQRVVQDIYPNVNLVCPAPAVRAVKPRHVVLRKRASMQMLGRNG